MSVEIDGIDIGWMQVREVLEALFQNIDAPGDWERLGPTHEDPARNLGDLGVSFAPGPRAQEIFSSDSSPHRR